MFEGPKVTILNGGVIMNESTHLKVSGNHNLKYLVDSLKVVQRETNEFLTKVIQERSQNNASVIEAADKDTVEEEDDDEDDDNDDNVSPKKRKCK